MENKTNENIREIVKASELENIPDIETEEDREFHERCIKRFSTFLKYV